MHGTVFDIGLGLGLAAACGLRPFLPLLRAGALASGGDLGVSFARGGYHFLQSSAWLLAVAAALAASYAAQIVLAVSPVPEPGSRARAGVLASALAGLALGSGAVLFAGTLADHHELVWPGIIGGLAATALALGTVSPLIARARRRLADNAARHALTLYLDAASLLLAALVSALHPLGYVAVAALAWFAWRGRTRGQERYAGLRVLRR